MLMIRARYFPAGSLLLILLLAPVMTNADNNTVDIYHIGSSASGDLGNTIVDQASITDPDWTKRRATNRLTTSGSVQITGSDGEVEFRAPRIVLRPGFHALPGSSFNAGTHVFKISCINLTSPCMDAAGGSDIAPCCVDGSGNAISCRDANAKWNTNARLRNGFFGNPPADGMGLVTAANQTRAIMTQQDFLLQCENEVVKINYWFRSENDIAMARFVLREAILWDPDFETSQLYDECVAVWGPPPGGTDDQMCPDFPDIPAVVDGFPDLDTNAINLFIYRHPRHPVGRGGFAGRSLTTSNNVPYIFMDYTHQDEDLQAGWADLNGNGIRDDDPDVTRMRSGEVHELGHVFGLGHMAHKTDREPGIMFTGPIGSCVDSSNNCCPSTAGSCTDSCESDPDCCAYGFGWIDLDGSTNIEDDETGYCNNPPSNCPTPHPLSGTGFAFLAKPTSQYCTQFYATYPGRAYDGTSTDFGQAEIVFSFAEYYAKDVFK